jgi:hypothetical protein
MAEGVAVKQRIPFGRSGLAAILPIVAKCGPEVIAAENG